jgi:hypothetical protein
VAAVRTESRTLWNLTCMLTTGLMCVMNQLLLQNLRPSPLLIPCYVDFWAYIRKIFRYTNVKVIYCPPPQKKKWIESFSACTQNSEKWLLALSYLPVCMEQFSSHWMNFNDNSYLSIFQKSVEKVQVSLNLTWIMGTLREYIFAFMAVSCWIILRMRNVSDIHSFSILSDDRSKASSKTIPPHSAI